VKIRRWENKEVTYWGGAKEGSGEREGGRIRTIAPVGCDGEGELRLQVSRRGLKNAEKKGTRSIYFLGESRKLVETAWGGGEDVRPNPAASWPPRARGTPVAEKKGETT